MPLKLERLSMTDYVVDGSEFRTLTEAAKHFTARLGLLTPWNGNLDALDDILSGGFGTPDEGFILTWRHSETSRQRLGYPATVAWLEDCCKTCHPSNVPNMRVRLADAQKCEGQTLFDILVEIIGGHEEIVLRLE